MEEKQEEKREEEGELDDRERLIGLLYVLHNLIERFKITKTEENALNYVIFLINRERGWLKNDDYKAQRIEEEYDDAIAAQKPSDRVPGLGMVNMGVEGYA